MTENTNHYNTAMNKIGNIFGNNNNSQRGNYTHQAYQAMNPNSLLNQTYNIGGSMDGLEGQSYGTLLNGSMGYSGDQTAFQPGSVQGSMLDGQTYGDMGSGQGGINFTGNDLMGVASFGMNAYNMMNQWDYQDSMLGLAQNADQRSQEQWGVAKEEMGRIARVGENIQAGYNQGGNYQQQAAANPSRRESEYIDV